MIGDQIYVWRRLAHLDGIYQHHGIDMGDGHVIHYRKTSEVVEQTPWDNFSRGDRIYRREYPQGFAFLPEVTIKRAVSRLGENKYNLLFNNCEHLATWCKTGISESKQVINFLPTINKLDTYGLFNSLKNSFRGVDKQQSNKLIDDALRQIRPVWDTIQPQYRQALEEMNTWKQVAYQALEKDREDLAKEALKRKQKYENKARKLEQQLENLALMTENLLQNQINS